MPSGLKREALSLALAVNAGLFGINQDAKAATFTVTADRDANLDEDRPTEQDGASNKLDLKTENDGTRRETGILGFTLPSIPTTETITAATLVLRVTKQGPETMSVHRVTDSWTETTVTWENTGLDFATPAEATFTAPTNNVFISIPITSVVRQWYDGTFTNHGIVLIGAAGTDMEFASREATTVNNRPMLVITTVTNPAISNIISSVAVSDPVNATTNPKRIPNGVVQYDFLVSNAANGTTDSGSTTISQTIPPTMSLFVGDLSGAGSGPITFTNGTPSSELTYSFLGLSSTTDSLSFSNNGGTGFDYVPVPDVNGFDAAVTNIRVQLGGSFAPKTGGSDPNFTLTLRMRTK